jgi:hypothetical protein
VQNLHARRPVRRKVPVSKFGVHVLCLAIVNL